MASETKTLRDAMEKDVEAWIAGGDVRIEQKYGEAIESAGPVGFFSDLFATYGDSRLDGWMTALAFAWSRLSYASWLDVLYRVSSDRGAVYQFVAFGTRYLALDVVRLINEDAGVNKEARALASVAFPNGGYRPGAEGLRKQLADCGVDQEELWRRLQQEGAPMRERAK